VKIKLAITFPFWEQVNVFVTMRVIAIKTLKDIKEFHQAEQALLS
jgi:hypothetical protein